MISSKTNFCCLLSLWLFSFSQILYAANEHNHNSTHSDALLFLLGEKLALKKLQVELNQDTSAEQKTANLEKQKQHLNSALPVLNDYLSRPESFYPNMQMYHDSLKSRGAILSDFSSLIHDYFKGVSAQPF